MILTVSTTFRETKIVTAIPDTEPAPNVNREHARRTNWWQNVQPIQASVRPASISTLTVKRTISLPVGIGGDATNAVFGPGLKLATVVILATALTSNNVLITETKIQ